MKEASSGISPSHQVASFTLSCGGIPGSRNRETENLLLERLHIQYAVGMPKDPTGGTGESSLRKGGRGYLAQTMNKLPNEWMGVMLVCTLAGPYDFCNHGITDRITELANKNGIYC